VQRRLRPRIAQPGQDLHENFLIRVVGLAPSIGDDRFPMRGERWGVGFDFAQPERMLGCEAKPPSLRSG